MPLATGSEIRALAFVGAERDYYSILAQSFFHGARAKGVTVLPYGVQRGAGACVTCGMRPEHAKARAAARRRGLPLVVLELGYMRRATSKYLPTGYYQVGIGGIGWVPREQTPPDRFDALNLPVYNDHADASGCWLIVGQVPNDAQHRLDADKLLRWYERAADGIRAKHAGAHIIFRSHPKGPLVLNGVEQQNGMDNPINFHAVRCVVTYNSTFFYESTLAGVPVQCAPCAHYASECAPVGAAPACRTASKKLPFLRRMAYAQWTAEELAAGEAWGFLKNKLQQLHFSH